MEPIQQLMAWQKQADARPDAREADMDHADELEQERKRLRDENAKPRSSADEHDSDCAMHNEPAYPNGPCDCSAAMQKGE